MKGWNSDFAFYLLQLMALFSILSYLGLLASYIHSIALFKSNVLTRITGSNYQGSFFSYVLTNACLTAHRLLYTLFPFKARNILSENLLRLCLVLILAFYIVYVSITLTPLASVVYCPAQLFFYFEWRPLLRVLQT
ncbi:unnamed protein product [Strongylus vulgaris]|uniref:7TM GPCR serpentine receptor class x (Srx) domain-containing protein n=1 Tax=Strongylus vulgaris TaxID=40348 RepID=A0A3P7IQR0_STRVU|nr:unnamed protein product [Strongylus vulgaris]